MTRRCLARMLAVSVLLWNLMAGFGFVVSQSRRLPFSSTTIYADSRDGVASTEAVAMVSPVWVSPQLSPLEAWCVTHMDVLYSRSLSIKCPFLKRRTADMLDGLDMMMRFLVIRHKSLDLIGPPPGCRAARMSPVKHLHTTLDERLDIIRHDWRPQTNKGYYITGRLNTTIYRDDCLFDGPDPDMPVRGLRKYINAASHLFDHASSTAELLSLDTVLDATSKCTVIEAQWRLQGVLHLPWHPQLPVWTGRTRYHFDDEGLVCLHIEEWDISVLQAFMETLFPEFAARIWVKSEKPSDAVVASKPKIVSTEYAPL